ncbi:sulfatase-like hydrolase/transferase [Nesterenkonia alba]|uniref:sulfatase-like hydrolase/transferase n=1 Tax=Nesterenkonia alba TaxID=515814 RepID=UPI0003B4B54E|nr:sulfatase-like hydrolase/transferase [Nesterenkonia alba]
MGRPNVVVFFTDQQRWDSTGVAGNPEGLTPNLDRAARDGAFFDVAVTPQPVCTPARASLQTGRFATSTGVWRNGIALGEEADSLARVFSSAGYQTGYIGKWHLAEPSIKGPVRPEQRGGYDYWLAANGLEHTSDAYATSLWDGDEQEVTLPGYRVDALTDAAIRYIDDRSEDDEPFFLFLSFLEPHHQNHRDDYPGPEAYEGRYTGAWMPPDLAALRGTAYQHIDGYYGMIKRLDEAYGRIREAIKSLGLDEDTVVAFTSDHGSHFKTRNSEYKRSVHDASARVPLVLTGPGVPQGRYVKEVVSTVDLPPTLVDLAGINVPESYQGRSLRGLLTHYEADWKDEAFIQVSESELARGIRTRRWKYGIQDPDADPLAQPHSDSYVETYLYDLKADPYELRNLAGSPAHEEVRAVLREKLLWWMEHAGEPMPVAIRPAEQDTGASQLRVSAEEARH